MKSLAGDRQRATFSRIAQELNVSRGTLVNWSRKFQFEIKNMRAIELEALQEQLIASRETAPALLGTCPRSRFSSSCSTSLAEAA